jgi:putative transposase
VDGYPATPRGAVTDKLARYGPAIKKVVPRTDHRRHRGLNNRAENAHQPTRQRERALRRFTSPGQALRFREPCRPTGAHVSPGRHRRSAAPYRAVLCRRCATWHAVTVTAAEHGARQQCCRASGRHLVSRSLQRDRTLS